MQFDYVCQVFSPKEFSLSILEFIGQKFYEIVSFVLMCLKSIKMRYNFCLMRIHTHEFIYLKIGTGESDWEAIKNFSKFLGVFHNVTICILVHIFKILLIFVQI